MGVNFMGYFNIQAAFMWQQDAQAVSASVFASNVTINVISWYLATSRNVSETKSWPCGIFYGMNCTLLHNC